MLTDLEAAGRSIGSVFVAQKKTGILFFKFIDILWTFLTIDSSLVSCFINRFFFFNHPRISFYNIFSTPSVIEYFTVHPSFFRSLFFNEISTHFQNTFLEGFGEYIYFLNRISILNTSHSKRNQVIYCIDTVENFLFFPKWSEEKGQWTSAYARRMFLGQRDRTYRNVKHFGISKNLRTYGAIQVEWECVGKENFHL